MRSPICQGVAAETDRGADFSPWETWIRRRKQLPVLLTCQPASVLVLLTGLASAPTIEVNPSKKQMLPLTTPVERRVWFLPPSVNLTFSLGSGMKPGQYRFECLCITFLLSSPQSPHWGFVSCHGWQLTVFVIPPDTLNAFPNGTLFLMEHLTGNYRSEVPTERGGSIYKTKGQHLPSDPVLSAPPPPHPPPELLLLQKIIFINL